jgi:hypothetical protein
MQTFEREFESNTIIAPTSVNDFADFDFILDTAASCTTIDKNVVIIEGIKLGKRVKINRNETSKGMLDIDVFLFDSVSAFGITRYNVEVQVYDFLEQGILSNYQGMLGLNFFEGTKFAIDMVENTIEVEEKSCR